MRRPTWFPPVAGVVGGDHRATFRERLGVGPTY
jgi:hypothetical protein